MNTKVSLSYALGLLSVLSAGSAQAISLSFSPVSQTVILGQPAKVALTISDLVANSAPSLGAFDLDVTFDPTILSFNFNSLTFGDPILGDQLNLDELGSSSGATLKNSSTVNIFEVSTDLEQSLNDLQADNFILATLTFNTLSLGTSPLNLSEVVLASADGQQRLTATLGNGSIIVISQIPTPIPESSSPAALLVSLFGVVLRKLSPGAR